MELIAVIAITAILAVSATAMFSTRSFDTARFARELEATMAFAQKSAVAQRRTVSVTVAATGVTYSICSDFACTAQVPLSLPTSGIGGKADVTGAQIAAPTGVVVSATVGGAAKALPFTFTFTPVGGTSGLTGGLVLTAAGDINKTVVVERDTGYVYAP